MGLERKEIRPNLKPEYQSRRMLFRILRELGPGCIMEDLFWLKKHAKSSPGLIPVKIGEVINPLEKVYPAELAYRKVKARVPARLNTLLLSSTAPITSEKMGIYPDAGSLNFAVDYYTDVTVAPREDKQVVILNPKGPSAVTVYHTAELMREALGIKDKGLTIEGNLDPSARPHSGLSTETSLSTATAFAINHLFGEPIPLEILHRYLSQNNLEEIPGNTEYGTFMLSFGGVAGLARGRGGVMLLGGEQRILRQVPLPSDLKMYVFGREAKEHFTPDEETAAIDGTAMSMDDLFFGIEAAEARKTRPAREGSYNIILQAMKSWDNSESDLYRILGVIGGEVYKYVLNEGLGRWARMAQLKWRERLPTAEEDLYSFKELRNAGVPAAFTSCFGPTSVAFVRPGQEDTIERFLERHDYRDFEVRKPDNQGVQYEIER